MDEISELNVKRKSVLHYVSPRKKNSLFVVFVVCQFAATHFPFCCLHEIKEEEKNILRIKLLILICSCSNQSTFDKDE